MRTVSALSATYFLVIVFATKESVAPKSNIEVQTLEEYKSSINYVAPAKFSGNARVRPNAAVKRRGGLCTAKVPNINTKESQSAAISGDQYRWEKLLIFIDTKFDDNARSIILEAFLNIRQHICIPLQILKSQPDPNSTDLDYIFFRSGKRGTGCNSHVGKQRGEQIVQLETPVCIYEDTVIHELMHALGYWHEHSRTDRDEFVTILAENVLPDNLPNFRKEEGTLTFRLPYDQNSIMHYPDTAFSIDPSRPTIISKNGKPIGNNGELTYTDILKLRIITRCSSPHACETSCSGISPYFNTAPGVEFDLKVTLNSSLSKCCAQCRNFAGCKAFVFNSVSKICYLKKQNYPRFIESGIETISGSPAAKPFDDAPACHGMVEGLDISPGHEFDIAEIPCNSLNVCCLHCTSNRACKGFVYSKERQMCFLKNVNSPWVETPLRSDISGLPGIIPGEIYQNGCI